MLEASAQFEQENSGHGRYERRRCWAFDAVDRRYEHTQWADLRAFAIVENTRTVSDKTSTERRYYLSSLPADAQRIARAMRSHWEVANRLHWCLDVQFADDYARARTAHAAHNLAVVREPCPPSLGTQRHRISIPLEKSEFPPLSSLTIGAVPVATRIFERPEKVSSAAKYQASGLYVQAAPASSPCVTQDQAFFDPMGAL